MQDADLLARCRNPELRSQRYSTGTPSINTPLTQAMMSEIGEFMHQRGNNVIGSTSAIGMQPKEAEVHAALGDVGRKLDQMQEQLGILIAKLIPVMRNEPNGGPDISPTRGYSSPIAVTLDSKVDQIGLMIHDIYAAIDRLEI